MIGIDLVDGEKDTLLSYMVFQLNKKGLGNIFWCL